MQLNRHLNSGKCKTPLGFRKALVDAFYLPEIACKNINDINCYIFSSWLGYRKIRMIFNNSGALKKHTIYMKIQEILELWKIDWESKDSNNKVTIEFKQFGNVIMGNVLNILLKFRFRNPATING